MPETRHSWIIDVIEEDSAAIEVDGRTVTPVPRWILPSGAREGDVLSVTHDRDRSQSALTITIDPEAKKLLLEHFEDQVRRIPKNGSGNVSL